MSSSRWNSTKSIVDVLKEKHGSTISEPVKYKEPVKKIKVIEKPVEEIIEFKPPPPREEKYFNFVTRVFFDSQYIYQTRKEKYLEKVHNSKAIKRGDYREGTFSQVLYDEKLDNIIKKLGSRVQIYYDYLCKGVYNSHGISLIKYDGKNHTHIEYPDDIPKDDFEKFLIFINGMYRESEYKWLYSSKIVTNEDIKGYHIDLYIDIVYYVD